LYAPLRGHGFGAVCLRRDPCDEWLDGVSDALASGLRRSGQTHAPIPSADYPPRASMAGSD